MINTRSLLSSLFLLPLLASGCDAAYPEVDSTGFRAGSLDVNVAISAADGGDDDGSILWEIVEVGATAGDGGDDDGSILWELVDTEATADGGASEGTIIWDIVETTSSTADGGDDDGSILWEIVEVNAGATICRVKDGQLSHVREHVLLSRQGNAVLDPKGNKVFKVSEDTLFDAKTGSPIVRVDADLEAASDGRVLTIAALVAGLCRE